MEIPDLSKYQAKYKSLEDALDKLPEDADPAELLISFPKASKYQGIVRCDFNELTAYCPWTRFPDQGGILLEYRPSDVLLELKSFKYYLLAFRDRSVTQEHLAEAVFDDMMRLLKPQALHVVLDYMPRGGIHTVYEIGSID